MKTIKTLAQAYRLAGAHQITIQELINGRMYIDGKGWVEVTLKDELKQRIADDVSGSLGGQKETKRRVWRTLRWQKPMHWGLSRFIVNKYDHQKEPKIIYITGQNQTWENREIRNYLKR